MRQHGGGGMTIRAAAAAAPGAAIASDVDTIRYASTISGHPRTVQPPSRGRLPPAPASVKNAACLSSDRLIGTATSFPSSYCC